MWVGARLSDAMVRKHALPALAVVAVLLLAGCSALQGQTLDESQEDRLVERLENRFEDVSAVQATIDQQSSLGANTTATTTEVRIDFETGEYRMELLAPEAKAGDVTVYNGSVVTSYDASENSYRAFEMDTPNTASVDDSLGSLFERSDVVYNGTAELDGQRTQQFTLVPENDSESFYDRTTVWVDTEEMLPVKVELAFGIGDETATTTVRLSNVTLNPEFETGTFEFEPPTDATQREDLSPQTLTTDDYEEVTSKVAFDLPDADLPRGFDFQEATVLTQDGDAQNVQFTYSDGDRSLWVVVSPDPNYEPPSKGETVTVGDHEAQYRTFDEAGTLAWSCEDTRYAVSGPLEKSTLVDVAAGVDC